MGFKIASVLSQYHSKIVRPAFPFLKIQKQIILSKQFISSMFLNLKVWVAFQNLKLEPNHLLIKHQNMIHHLGKSFMILKKF